MADLSPSSTVYYFDDHEELLAEAAKLNIRAWAHIAETIADEAVEGLLENRLEICLDWVRVFFMAWHYFSIATEVTFPQKYEDSGISFSVQ